MIKNFKQCGKMVKLKRVKSDSPYYTGKICISTPFITRDKNSKYYLEENGVKGIDIEGGYCGVVLL